MKLIRNGSCSCGTSSPAVPGTISYKLEMTKEELSTYYTSIRNRDEIDIKFKLGIANAILDYI
jgi:hypothetical protein